MIIGKIFFFVGASRGKEEGRLKLPCRFRAKNLEVLHTPCTSTVRARFLRT
jgi:hypothetical protein